MRMLLLVGICLAVCINANAPKKQWRLEECIAHAYEHNISIKQQELLAEEKRIALSESKWNYAPDISISNSYSLSTGRVLDPTTYDFVENRTVAGNNTSVGASIPLFGGLRNHRELRRAKLDLRSALLSAEKLRNDIRLNVTAYYLEILCAEEQIRAAEQTVAVLQVQERKTAVKVDTRKVTMADLLQIRSQLADAENEILTVRNTYDIARLNLCQLLEIADYSAFRTIAPDTTRISLISEQSNNSLSDVVQFLPEVEAARVGIDMARQDLQIARAGYYPTISLSVGYGSSYSDARQKMFQNPDGTYRYEAYTFFEQYRDNASSYVSLPVSISIFGKFTTRKNVQRQKLAVQRAEYELYTIEKQAEKEVVQATIDVHTAWQRYLGAQKFVQSADEALRQVTRKYELGVATVVDYNTALDTRTKAQIQLLHAKYEYIFKTKVLSYYYTQ